MRHETGAEERAHETIDTDILCLSYQRGRDILERRRPAVDGGGTGHEAQFLAAVPVLFPNDQTRSQRNGEEM